MTMLISFPFRVESSGAVAVRDDGSDEYLGEELAQLIQTQPGERELVPSYGINDPAYAQFDTAMLAAQIGVFGPPVIIEQVTSRPLDDARRDVVVRFRAAPHAVEDGEDISNGVIVTASDYTPAYEEFA